MSWRCTGSARAWGALVAVALTSLAADAQAVRYRRPFGISVGVNYGRDNDGGSSGCTDYGCGSVCYDGHSGTDFPLSLGTNIYAAANGVVSATYNGCANYGGLGSTCGGGCGNYVRIDHADGQRTLYCHMQLGSIAVANGQGVSCGDFIGRSASSGNSSGPHLHFGHYINGSTHDPFAGSCSQSTSYWMSQGSYPHPMPSTACEPSCQCTPGQVQQGSCGNCGTRQRTCQPSCNWGGWSACQGEGECAAGTIDTRPCCDCGTESRLCSSSCSWGSWDACAGPDPGGGTDPCETGEPGLCAEGVVRCLDGCVTCVSLWEPQPESCDGRDEDCSGVVDDGFPEEMGDPPPPLAAGLVDLSYSPVLAPGEQATAWATFRNVGTEPWPAGEVWLAATTTWDGAASQLHDQTSWPAYDVAAVLQEDVPPGMTGTFVWTIRVAPGASGLIEERFQLSDLSGEALRCPSPALTLQVHVVGADGPHAAAGGAAAAEVEEDGGCGCHLARSRPAPAWWAVVLLGAAVAGGRRRAVRHRGRHCGLVRSDVA